MKCPCKYEYNEERGVLRFNCLGSLCGASIEDYGSCMVEALDGLLEVRKASSIVFAKDREYEYGPEQVRMLLEIVEVIEQVYREKYLSHMGPADCRPFFSEWSSKLQYIIIELLRTDPIGSYVEIKREIRATKIKAEHNPKLAHCYKHYINILTAVQTKLEGTQLIKLVEDQTEGLHVGDRSLYRDIFTPSIRPNFMLTRFMITPPEGGKSIDRYQIGDTEIEIFKIPGETQLIYYALPPEFKLPEDQYKVLDAARRYMAAHRPKAAEFVRSSDVRKIFFNIGKDMIRETADNMHIPLKAEDIEKLASILTRYTAGFGVLEVLLADENIQDIFLNSPIERQPILINHSKYEECKTNLIPTIDDAESWATRLRIQSGRPLDEANPVLDTGIEVPGGRARFAVITRSLSPEGLAFAIRRHRDSSWTLPLYIQPKIKMMDALSAGLLSFFIDNSASLLVAGGRGSGKTSVLGALMLEMLPKIRQIVIEDTLELPVNQLRDLGYNIESLKSRSVITRVETEMSADEALRTALRLGDSSLIIGEIRSLEAKVLWEAMRIGALSNVVAGTIHGESAYGVYDRVVNDLGVPNTSFKATDIVIICRKLRSADGLHSFRRLVGITEIRKHWDQDPMKEGGFVDLMSYSSKRDSLEPSDTLVNGESEILNRVASYVREYAGDWAAVWDNINLRARIKKTMVDISEKVQNPILLEAPWNVKSNSQFHLISDSIRKETGFPDTKRVYKEWLTWFKGEIKSV